MTVAQKYLGALCMLLGIPWFLAMLYLGNYLLSAPGFLLAILGALLLQFHADRQGY